MYVCMYTNVIPHTYIYTYIPIHTHICYTYIYTHRYGCMDVWVYGYMYIYVYMDICMYIWIHGYMVQAIWHLPQRQILRPRPRPHLRFTTFHSPKRYPTGLSTQPISLQYCCFRPHLRCKHLFAGYFSYTPWTYSTAHPLTDVEYADDTVLVARTQEDTLSRLFHLLQHMAAQIGLLLNGSKCQLLSCVSMPLFLSLFLSVPMPSITAIFPTASLSSQPLLILHPWTFLLLLSNLPSTLVLVSPLPLPLFQTSTFDALKPPLLSSPRSPF